MLEVAKKQVWEDLQKRFKRVVDRIGTHEEKALKLKEYQEEMQAFTAYLKQIHFQV